MKYFGGDTGEKHAKLSKLIRRRGSADEAKALFFEIHSALNMPCVYGCGENETARLFDGMSARDAAVIPTSRDESIAWSVWHIARIEDVTMGMLAARGEQVFCPEWQERTGSPIADTGNALSGEELFTFGQSLDLTELIHYRNEVARRTREIVGMMTEADLLRRVSADDIARLAASGAVTEDEDSRWLLDYWGGKDVAGLLLMPPTRHALLHLNNCARIKRQLTVKKSFYRS